MFLKLGTNVESMKKDLAIQKKTVNSKGRTIRKVMGGRGIFSLHDFFFRPLLVQEFFLQVKPSARIFFFRQRLLCLSFSNFKRTILQKNCCTLLVLIIIKDHF